ncbi:hypothetical protein AKJ16_DCAP23994 [Drosera capensis]
MKDQLEMQAKKLRGVREERWQKLGRALSKKREKSGLYERRPDRLRRPEEERVKLEEINIVMF